MSFDTQLRHLARGEEDNVFSAALPALLNFCCVSKDNGLRLGAKILHSPLSQIGRDKWLAWAFPRSCSSTRFRLLHNLQTNRSCVSWPRREAAPVTIFDIFCQESTLASATSPYRQ